jgi:hypothetical protein
MTQRSFAMRGKFRHIERLVIRRWPASSFAKSFSRKRADSSSESAPSPARAKVSGCTSKIQVERSGSYW